MSRQVPGAVIALILTSLAAAYFHWPVETIGSRFGDLPHALPMPHLPFLNLHQAKLLIRPAMTIALLGAIESLLSAVVSDGMIGGRHRSNMELVGQGVANIGSALFGGMPATGAIARTVTNIKNGGRTPVAGIIHALVILLILLFFGAWIRFIPLACLAGILTVVAYNMSEWRSFRELLGGFRGAKLVLLATFGLTVLVDLTVAIEWGVVMSAFIFMHRMTQQTNVQLLVKEVEEDEDREPSPVMKVKVPSGVEVYEINGPLFFGVAHKFEEATRVVAAKPKVRILRLRHVTLIDSTGLQALKAFHHKCLAAHIRLLVTGLHVQPLNELVKTDLYELIGPENVFENIQGALDQAKRHLDQER